MLAANPGTLPLTARFKKFFAQRTLAESTRIGYQFQLPTSLSELRQDKVAQHIEASIKRNH